MMSVSVYSEYQRVSYYTCLSSQDGYSALMEAAWKGYTEIVVELVKAEANLNLQNKVQYCICLIHTYTGPAETVGQVGHLPYHFLVVHTGNDMAMK